MSRFGRLAPAARRSWSFPSPVISPSVHAAAGKALWGFRACAPCCVLAGAWLEKEPKALGRAVGPCALFGWMVVTWLLMLEFRDQLPNPLLSQRERLPGMQKMGKKKKKKAITLEMAGGVTSCTDQPAEACDSGGKGTQDHPWQCKGTTRRRDAPCGSRSKDLLPPAASSVADH